jgi:hypothetical protein
MPAMYASPSTPPPERIALAVLLSALVHGLILLLAPATQTGEGQPSPPLQARLAAPRPAPQRPTPVPPAAPRMPSAPRSLARTPARKAESRPAILTARTPQPGRVAAAEPKWSVAQKAEMGKFLDELAHDAQQAPSLAERSLSMARNIGREQEQHGNDDTDVVERKPDSPPIDALSLDMYLDSLVKKLNRGAAFVKNDPRTRGVQSASVLVRIAPDGSLASFKVLRAGDQQAEIDFTHAVVKQAAPFAAFPPDIRRSANSLAMLICILPPTTEGGTFGFTRTSSGHGCH